MDVRGPVMQFASGLRTKIEFYRWRCTTVDSGAYRVCKKGDEGLAVAGVDGKEDALSDKRRKGRHG